MNELSPDLLELIEAETDGLSAPAEAKRATWKALEASIAANAVPPVDLAPSSVPTVMSAAKSAWWWIVPLVVVGAIGGGVAVTPTAVEPPPVKSVPSVSNAPVVIEPPRVSAAVVTATVVAKRSPVRRKRKPPKPSSPEPEDAQDLAAELVILRAAQIALSKDDLAAALVALEDHRTRFPKGVIAEERSALRVIVLCKLRRGAPAEEARASFMREYPKSPQRQRIEAECDAVRGKTTKP